MNIKLFQCVVEFEVNSLTFSLLAVDEESAIKLVKSRLDKETRDELDSGRIKCELKEYPLEPCLISMETSIKMN